MSADAYPDAERLDLVEDLHGVEVADPYRWLEDAAAPATVEWSAAQDDRWASYAAGLDARPPLRRRLTALIPGFTGAPHVIGARRFWMARSPGQDHAVLWVSDAAGPRALVDPNALSDDGTVTLDGWSPSVEGERVAYQLSSGGDEESRIWIVDVATGGTVEGPIDRARYSPLQWLPGGRELFYVRRLAPDLVPADQTQYHRRVYRHVVGTDPADDVEVFGAGVDMTAYFGVDASEDGTWVAVTTSLGTAPRNDLHLRSLGAADDGGDGPWIPVLVDTDAQAWQHFDQRGALWLLTDLAAPRKRMCRVELAAGPGSDGGFGPPADWPVVIPEDSDGAVLEDFVLAGDYLVVLWSRHAISEIAVHDRASGQQHRRVTLPGVGSADLTGRRDEGPDVWVGYTDHATPYTVFTLDPATGAISPAPSPADVSPADVSPATPGASTGPGPAAIVSHQRVAVSADGTEVRLTVVAGAMAPDRPRPTVLYGYGGFGVSLTPAYSSSIRAWVEAGGVWVVAHLRGGSEEGEAWHRDGMRDHKQHVFEDFEAVADLLVAEGWTTPAQLGIFGGSNGGLLVGAALTRSPERYAAVVCSAPLLDMVRYERFGLGVTWNDEYGRADDPVELGWLLGISPYHHVRAGTDYPAVVFTIFDSDTRVDPLHARKLAAALQWATSADPARHPVLVRREADVGHGARSVTRTVELAADQLAFFGRQLGLDLSDVDRHPTDPAPDRAGT
jgi:prolyl oligopeptidase